MVNYANIHRAALLLAALAVLAASVKANKVDLPVATSGTDQWAGVVAKAMTFGAGNQDSAMKNFENFQARAISRLQKTVSPLPGSCRPASALLCWRRQPL